VWHRGGLLGERTTTSVDHVYMQARRAERLGGAAQRAAQQGRAAAAGAADRQPAAA
jgi:hypothetical protein